MVLLIRLAALLVLWLLGRRLVGSSAAAQGMTRLGWSARIELCWRLVRDRRLSWPARGVAFLPALYLLSPIDLVPDFIPVLGRMDDAVIFSVLVGLFVAFAPVAVVEEHIAAIDARGRPRAR